MARISTLLCSLALIGSINAQTVEVTDLNGNVVNGSTVTFYGDPNTNWPMNLELDLHTENISGQSTVINVKRYEISVQPNTRNYFCWGVCYTPEFAGDMPLWVSGHTIDMEIDSVYANFHAYHVPEGNVGLSTYRYVWYKVSDPNDSTFVDIVFDTENVSVGELANLVARFDLFPNPATGTFLNAELDLAPTVGKATLVIHDALGGEVHTQELGHLNGRYEIPTTGLENGVYFCSIRSQGRMLATERLVIGRN